MGKMNFAFAILRLATISVTLHKSTWLPAELTAFSNIFHDEVSFSSLGKLWWILTIQPNRLYHTARASMHYSIVHQHQP
jgi:hypothetical protein